MHHCLVHASDNAPKVHLNRGQQLVQAGQPKSATPPRYNQALVLRLMHFKCTTYVSPMQHKKATVASCQTSVHLKQSC